MLVGVRDVVSAGARGRKWRYNTGIPFIASYEQFQSYTDSAILPYYFCCHRPFGI
jgi:hypothetical protein